MLTSGKVRAWQLEPDSSSNPDSVPFRAIPCPTCFDVNGMRWMKGAKCSVGEDICRYAHTKEQYDNANSWLTAKLQAEEGLRLNMVFSNFDLVHKDELKKASKELAAAKQEAVAAKHEAAAARRDEEAAWREVEKVTYNAHVNTIQAKQLLTEANRRAMLADNEAMTSKRYADVISQQLVLVIQKMDAVTQELARVRMSQMEEEMSGLARLPSNLID